jgi:thiamine-phosphate pyrophosphorylase
MKNFDLTLYLVTDDHMKSFETMVNAVKKAIQGGATLVQFRDKQGESGELYRKAKAIKEITDACHIPLIIDDRIDIMLAADAAGVHVGQKDIPADIARSIIGPDKILGVSAQTVEEAVKAEKDGADYLGVGAMFPTQTKKDAIPVSMETLKEIKEAVNIPITAIGGINQKTIPQFHKVPVDGYAVVSAIMGSTHPKQAAEELKREINLLKK